MKGKTRREKKREILTRDGNLCQYCGKDLSLEPDSACHLDHKIPKKQGGRGTKDNLTAACRSCNCSKRNQTVEQYRATLLRDTRDKIDTIAQRLYRWESNDPTLTYEQIEEFEVRIRQAAQTFHDLLHEIGVVFVLDHKSSDEKEQ